MIRFPIDAVCGEISDNASLLRSLASGMCERELSWSIYQGGFAIVFRHPDYLSGDRSAHGPDTHTSNSTTSFHHSHAHGHRRIRPGRRFATMVTCDGSSVPMNLASGTVPDSKSNVEKAPSQQEAPYAWKSGRRGLCKRFFLGLHIYRRPRFRQETIQEVSEESLKPVTKTGPWNRSQCDREFMRDKVTLEAAQQNRCPDYGATTERDMPVAPPKRLSR